MIQNLEQNKNKGRSLVQTVTSFIFYWTLEYTLLSYLRFKCVNHSYMGHGCYANK